MRFTVRRAAPLSAPCEDRDRKGLVVVNLWMGKADVGGELEPRGQLSMTLLEFAFFRAQVLISSTVSVIYEPGIKAVIDAVETAEYVKAERATALRARS
jgi:hypothetical protein